MARQSFIAPKFADYDWIFGMQGEEVTVTVERTESDFDPALLVFDSLFGDTSEFGVVFTERKRYRGPLIPRRPLIPRDCTDRVGQFCWANKKSVEQMLHAFVNQVARGQTN